MTPLEEARRVLSMLDPQPEEDTEDFAIRMHKAFEAIIYSRTGRLPREWADMSIRRHTSYLGLARKRIRATYGAKKIRKRISFRKKRQTR